MMPWECYSRRSRLLTGYCQYPVNKTANNPEFQSRLTHYPSSSVASPHLFRKVAVPGVCVD
jgi:hypothetical protein